MGKAQRTVKHLTAATSYRFVVCLLVSVSYSDSLRFQGRQKVGLGPMHDRKQQRIAYWNDAFTYSIQY